MIIIINIYFQKTFKKPKNIFRLITSFLLLNRDENKKIINKIIIKY